MGDWLRRIRGALGMGLTWGVAWGVVGLLIGVVSLITPFLPWDGFFRVFDAPLPAFAVPGFIAGSFFSLALGIAGRHRRFEELSVGRFAFWGALGGLMLAVFPATMVLLGLATAAEGTTGIWTITAIIAPPFMLLSAGSAAATLRLAQGAAVTRLPDAGSGSRS